MKLKTNLNEMKNGLTGLIKKFGVHESLISAGAVVTLSAFLGVVTYCDGSKKGVIVKTAGCREESDPVYGHVRIKPLYCDVMLLDGGSIVYTHNDVNPRGFSSKYHIGDTVNLLPSEKITGYYKIKDGKLEPSSCKRAE